MADVKEPLLPTAAEARELYSEASGSDLARRIAESEQPWPEDRPVVIHKHLVSRLRSTLRVPSTFWPCVINLSKAILGASMMALPKAFALLGVPLATVCLVFVGVVTCFTLSGLVLVSEQTGTTTYSALVRKKCGKSWKHVLQCALICVCFGNLVVYVVVIGDILVGVKGNYNGMLCELLERTPDTTWWLDRKPVLAAITMLVLLPLVAIRPMERLNILNIVGVAAVVFFALAALGLSGISVWTGVAHMPPLLPDWAALGGSTWSIFTQVASLMPILLLADMCHQSIHPLMPILRPYSYTRMNGVCIWAVALCSALYLLICVCTIAVFGPALSQDVLTNMSAESLRPLVGQAAAVLLSYGVRVSYLVCLLGTFALVMFPLREVTMEALLPAQQHMRWFMPTTCVVMAGVYVVGVFAPNITFVLKFVGSTAATLIAFIFPGLIMLRHGAADDLGRRLYKAAAAGAVLLGVALFVNGCYTAFFMKAPKGTAEEQPASMLLALMTGARIQ